MIVVGFGGALYPQSIQRIYAADSARTLQNSLRVMAFLPLTTTLIAVLVGIYGAAYFPGLVDEKADTILTVLCRHVQQSSLFGYGLVVVLFSAVLAAIMSTADSVLLSISSMLTKDLYAVYVAPRASQKHLTRFGKGCSWGLIVLLAWAAIQLRGTTLITLLDRKFDLLVQLAPAFILGVRWSTLRGGPVLGGLLAGVAVSVALPSLGLTKPLGFHPGIFGLLVNLPIAVLGSLLPAGTSRAVAARRA